MLKKYFILLSVTMALFWGGACLAQSGVALYHLNHATFQANHFNPAFLPEGKVFFGFPVLSGMTVGFNSPLSYSQLIGRDQAGEREYNLAGIAHGTKRRNFLSYETELSTFYLGFKIKQNQAFTLFVRDRVSAQFFYGGSLLRLAWFGNQPFINSGVSLSQTRVNVNYYREYGLGLWKNLPNAALKIGFRLKFLNGMLNAKLDPRFKAKIDFNENGLSATLNHGVLNTSGTDLVINDVINKFDLRKVGKHLLYNKNYGFALDLGAEWKINERWGVALAFNDVGFITWNEGVKNFTVKDINLQQFQGIESFAKLNQDNMVNAWLDKLRTQFQYDTTYHAYTTWLNPKIYASVMYQLGTKNVLTGTIAPHISNFPYMTLDDFRMIYSIGFTRKVGRVLDISASVSKIPQQGVQIGLATALNFGALQIYIASDKLLRIYDLPQVTGGDLRFGINMRFGRPKKQKKRKKGSWLCDYQDDSDWVNNYSYLWKSLCEHQDEQDKESERKEEKKAEKETP